MAEIPPENTFTALFSPLIAGGQGHGHVLRGQEGRLQEGSRGPGLRPLQDVLLRGRPHQPGDPEVLPQPGHGDPRAIRDERDHGTADAGHALGDQVGGHLPKFF